MKWYAFVRDQESDEVEAKVRVVSLGTDGTTVIDSIKPGQGKLPISKCPAAEHDFSSDALWVVPNDGPGSGLADGTNALKGVPGGKIRVEYYAKDAGTTPTCTTEATVFALKLTVQHATRDLMDQNTFRIAVMPEATAVGSLTQPAIEIRRAAEAQWHELAAAVELADYVQRVAGVFSLRGRALASGFACSTAEEALEVRFPAYAGIVADAGVQARTDQAWQSTLAAATPTSRREEGFWIRINTEAGSAGCEFTATVTGPPVGPGQGATINLGSRPADNPASPAPNTNATYTVASFHTHTPTTYRTVGRPVGPSDADRRQDASDDVAGVAYDCVESPAGSGRIPPGHPLDGPAQRYHSGPDRRSTP